MTDEIITSGQYESRNKGKKKQYLHSFQKQGDDTFNLIVDKQSYEENRKQVLKEHTDKDTQLIILQEALDKKNDEDKNKLFQEHGEDFLSKLTDVQEKQFVIFRSQGYSFHDSYNKAILIPEGKKRADINLEDFYEKGD